MYSSPFLEILTIKIYHIHNPVEKIHDKILLEMKIWEGVKTETLFF